MSKELIKQLSKVHELYKENKNAWNRASAAYEGDDKFQKEYLLKYEGEHDNDYQARQNNASYENLTLDIVQRREQIVFGRTINRTIDKKPLKESALMPIADNVDLQNTSYTEFIKKCFHEAHQYGSCPVWIDMVVESDGEERSQYPYFSIINPFNLINWGTDTNGQLLWCIIKNEYVEAEDFKTSVKVIEYRVCTPKLTTVHRLEGRGRKKPEYVGSEDYSHELDRIPLVILRDLPHKNDPVIGHSSIINSIDRSIALYNQQSWYDQCVYLTNYNVPYLPEQPPTGTTDKEIVMGPSRPIIVSEGADTTPGFISAPTGPAEVFEKKINNMRRRIYEQAQLDAARQRETKEEMSGKAMQEERKPAEEMAKRWGRTLSAFEAELLTVTLKWLGPKPSEVAAIYPQRYNTSTTQSALEEIEKVEGSEYLPPDVKSEFAARLVFTQGYAEFTDEEQEELYQKIKNYNPNDEALKKIEAEKQIETKAELEKIQKQAEAEEKVERTRAENAPQQQTPAQEGAFFGTGLVERIQ